MNHSERFLGAYDNVSVGWGRIGRPTMTIIEPNRHYLWQLDYFLHNDGIFKIRTK